MNLFRQPGLCENSTLKDDPTTGTVTDRVLDIDAKCLRETEENSRGFHYWYTEFDNQVSYEVPSPIFYYASGRLDASDC